MAIQLALNAGSFRHHRVPLKFRWNQLNKSPSFFCGPVTLSEMLVPFICRAFLGPLFSTHSRQFTFMGLAYSSAGDYKKMQLNLVKIHHVSSPFRFGQQTREQLDVGEGILDKSV